MTDSIFWGAVVVAAVIMIIYYWKSKKPIKNAFLGIFSGAAGLLLVHFLGNYIGISLPLSIFNISVSLILGVPGVITLIILHFIA